LRRCRRRPGTRRSISTRIYLHLANDWLQGEYLRAAEAIEAQIDPTEAPEGEAA
jgi:hypothetical protein